MPKPASGDLHVSRPLTNVSVGWIQDNDNFASGMFGWVPSDNQSDEFFVWSKADLMRSEAKEVGPGGLAPIRGEDLATSTFACKVNKVRELLDQQRRANADEGADFETNSAEAVTQDLMMKLDKDWCARLFASGIWTNESQGKASPSSGNDFYQFSDLTNSQPIEVLRNRARRVQSSTGRKVNTAVIGPLVWDVLADHPDLLLRIQATQGPQVPTPQLLGQVLGIDRVIVPQAVTNTATEGAADATAHIFGKSILLAHVAPNPGKRIPSAWYSFMWRGLLGSVNGMRIRRYELPERDNSIVIEGEAAYDHRKVADELGHFLYDVVI